MMSMMIMIINDYDNDDIINDDNDDIINDDNDDDDV